MKTAKIFIVLTFLLVSAICVSAQGKPAWIRWEDLQEKYESFYDIKPTIVNLTGKTVYYSVADCAASLTLWRLNEENIWTPVSSWQAKKNCEVKLEKVGNFGRRTLHLSKEMWDEIVAGDSAQGSFKSLPNYNGKGKYMLGFTHVMRKVRPRAYNDSAGYITSPEFEVVEKDFKK